MRRDLPIAYVLLYVALYGAFGVASPFWPKLFESKGLTLQEVGWILAAALVVRLVTGPLVGRLADAMASLRLVLAVSIAMAAAAAAAFLAINTFWFVLLIALVQAAALAPTTSIADALPSIPLDRTWLESHSNTGGYGARRRRPSCRAL